MLVGLLLESVTSLLNVDVYYSEFSYHFRYFCV